ncbi:MAG: S8 family serine peptidase [Ignavibacteria bacterium]|nr:S8 family serine peptidase [Ignavibacteria bacterium]
MKNKKLTILLSLTIIVVLTVLGFEMQKSAITNYYYYKGEPFYLKLKSDVIFVKLSDNATSDSFNKIIAQFPEVNKSSSFNVKDKKDFIRINSNLDDKSIQNLVNRLNNTEGIEYSSPAFSPDEGKTLIGTENEIIVQYKSNVTKSQIAEFAKQKGIEQIRTMALTGGTSIIYKVNKNEYAIDVANNVYNSGLVNFSEPNLFFTNLACYVPNDPFFPRQWAIRNLGNNIPEGISGTAGCDMRVDSAWNITLGAAYVKVAINDTGCDTLHEDLSANFIPGTGYNFYNNTPGGYDDYGHGTGCAGIVGAVGNNNKGISGIAPNTKLMPVKWMNSSGNGDYAGATNAIIYCYQHGAWIISNSWGFVGGASNAMDQAITDCVNLGRSGKGTLFVVAAGNENGAMRYPASTHPSVLVVGGVSPCNQRKSTTSCDNETFWGASYGSNLDIVAPCVKIYATDMTSGGFTSTAYDSTFNGTSSATPNTSGVCALALALDSTVRWDSLRVRVGRTADRVGTYTYNQPGPRNTGLWNNEMGYGKVNALRLLQTTLQMMGPVITHSPLTNTEQITGTRPVNAVITIATAPIVTSMTKLFVLKQPASTYDSVQMTNSSGNNWTANITLSGAGVYRYYIRTADNAGRLSYAPFGAPGNYYSFTASTDTVKPVITHTPINNTPKNAWPISVSANVTDNIGIDSVWVRWYKNNTGLGVKVFKLPNTSGSTYSALFNSVNSDVAIGDSIFYRVIAQDNSSGHNRDSSALIKFTITNVVATNVCITKWIPIRDNVTTYDSVQVGTHSNIIKVNFTMVNLIHTYDGDVTFALRSPNGTEVVLTSGNGGSGANYINTVFNDSATTPIASGSAPFTGTFIPTNPLSAFNGQDAYGWWRFRVSDNAGGDTGHVGQYCIQIYSGGTLTGINNAGILPTKFELSQNYPNPFNPTTKINFAIPKQGLVTMKIYDVLGREVRTLVNEVKPAGNYSVDFNASELSSGVYFYRVQSGDFSDIKRMILIK